MATVSRPSLHAPYWRFPVSAAWLPTQADLQAATAATAAAIADPDITLADVERAADLEAALYGQLGGQPR